MDRWRLQTPATMMESPYLAHLGADLGEKAFSTARHVRRRLRYQRVEAVEVDKRSRKRSRSPRCEHGSMGRYLTQQAVKQGESKSSSRKKEKKEQSKKKEKKKRESSSSSSEKIESSSFQLAPARGASMGELWRAAQKKPRAVNQVGVGRNDPLPGRSSRRRGARPALEKSKDHGLPPSGPAGRRRSGCACCESCRPLQ